MYPEVYIFYTALTILTVFLTYKVILIARYDRSNKNSVYFNPRPRLEHHVTRHVYRIIYVTRDKIVRPLTFVVIKNTTYIVRGAQRSMNDLRCGRKRLGQVIEKSDVASSGYMQKMTDQREQGRKDVDE